MSACHCEMNPVTGEVFCFPQSKLEPLLGSTLCMWPAESLTAWRSVTRDSSSHGVLAAMDSWVSLLLKTQWRYQGKFLTGSGFLKAAPWRWCIKGCSPSSLQLVGALLFRGAIIRHFSHVRVMPPHFPYSTGGPWAPLGTQRSPQEVWTGQAFLLGAQKRKSECARLPQWKMPPCFV